MTDIEQEMLRKIHELDKELKQLRERVAVMEVKTGQWTNVPVFSDAIKPHPIKGWEVT